MYYGFFINFGERKVEIKRKVKDFDKDLHDDFWSFNPEHPVNPVKSLFEKPKVLSRF